MFEYLSSTITHLNLLRSHESHLGEWSENCHAKIKSNSRISLLASASGATCTDKDHLNSSKSGNNACQQLSKYEHACYLRSGSRKYITPSSIRDDRQNEGKYRSERCKYTQSLLRRSNNV